MKNIPILVDGPNFINRLLENGINPNHIAKQLSLETLRKTVNAHIDELDHLAGRCETVEFFCSNKRFGPQAKKFTEDQQVGLLDRLRKEIGVYIDVIDIPGSSEKGIDITISGKIEDYSSDLEAVVLITADRDYIPTLRKLRHKIKVLLVTVKEDYPKELSNEGYATLNLRQEIVGLFKYNYPRFNIEKFDEEQCAELFSQADDRHYNRLIVNKNCDIYFSKEANLNELNFVKFYWEIYCPYNDYVGPVAASNIEYIRGQTKEIKMAWEKGASGFIDFYYSI